MPVFITATLTNISSADHEGYKVMAYLRVLIRSDSEDKYTIYEFGTGLKEKVIRRLKTIKAGESWKFREVILYQTIYEPYVARSRRNPSGLRLKEPGRYWVVGKYNIDVGQWIESDPIAIDVSAPTSRLDRLVFDVLTCRDRDSQRKQLSEKDRLQCMNRYFRLLHTGEDPFTGSGVSIKFYREFAQSLWSLLEQGAGESSYGPAIKWALRKHIDYQHARRKYMHETQAEQPLSKEQKDLIKDAPMFRRGAR